MDKKNNENDEKIKTLFKDRSFAEASPKEIQQWKTHFISQPKFEKSFGWQHLAAACMVGVLIGFFLFNKEVQPENLYFAEHATIERVFVNFE